MTSRRVDEQSAARREAMPEATSNRPKLTGIVGDKAPESGDSRSGVDTRRRGWYWNWNTMVTQFAPLIGLDGKGLLDSYIVWTDRREDSPFRGYAFPSTTAEANFYGIDRNVLGTINKILVALDLIEIKKSMVNRPDNGNDWKFPHNTYRVKEQGDNFQLTADAVRRVVDLAVEDKAVFRRIKHIFGSKFKPIDPQSVWYDIVAELESTENWQKLRAITLEDERRTSERSRKGHAARKKSAGNTTPVTTGKPAQSTLESVPGESKVSTASTVDNDSTNDSTVETKTSPKSTAAQNSNGLQTSAEQSSKASGVQGSSDAASTSKGSPTIAQSTSTTNYTDQTTTTTGDKEAQNEVQNSNVQAAGSVEDFGGGPDDSRDRELTLRLFDEANEKPVTIAARRVLGKIASDFAELAQGASISGWAITGMAIEEAVSSGSTYVAPKRVREILNRWRRDGIPEEYAGVSGNHDRSAQNPAAPVTSVPDASHSFVRTSVPERNVPERVPQSGGDLASVWERTCVLLQSETLIADALHRQLVSDAQLLRIENGHAELLVSDRLNAVLGEDIQRVIQTKLSVAARRPLRLRVVTGEAPPPNVTDPYRQSGKRMLSGGVFDVPGSGMNSIQLWAAVQQALSAGGDIPRPELAMWATSSELLALDDETFILGFGSSFLCRRAEHRQVDLVREFTYLAGFSCEVEIVETSIWKERNEQGSA